MFGYVDDDPPPPPRDMPCHKCKRTVKSDDRICWWCGESHPGDEPRLTAEHIISNKRVVYLGRVGEGWRALPWIGKKGTIIRVEDSEIQPHGIIFTVQFDDRQEVDFNAPEVFGATNDPKPYG